MIHSTTEKFKKFLEKTFLVFTYKTYNYNLVEQRFRNYVTFLMISVTYIGIHEYF